MAGLTDTLFKKSPPTAKADKETWRWKHLFAH